MMIIYGDYLFCKYCDLCYMYLINVVYVYDSVIRLPCEIIGQIVNC